MYFWTQGQYRETELHCKEGNGAHIRSFSDECQICSDRWARLSCHLESQHPKVKQISQGMSVTAFSGRLVDYVHALSQLDMNQAWRRRSTDTVTQQGAVTKKCSVHPPRLSIALLWLCDLWAGLAPSKVNLYLPEEHCKYHSSDKSRLSSASVHRITQRITGPFSSSLEFLKVLHFLQITAILLF